MNQTLRLILAFVSSTLILFFYQMYFGPKPTDQIDTTSQVAQVQSTSTETTTLSSGEQNTNEPIKTDIPSQILNIETDKTQMTLNTKGGVFESYQLKEFHQDVSDKSPLRDLLKQTPNSSALFLGFQGYDALTPDRVFELVSDETKDQTRIVVLRWQDESLRVLKTIFVGNEASDYAVRVAYNVTNTGKLPLKISPYVQSKLGQKSEQKEGGIFSFLKRSQNDLYNRVYFKENKFEHEQNWTDFQNQRDEGVIAWSGIADRYFLVGHVAITQEDQVPTTRIEFRREQDAMVNRFLSEEVTLNPGATSEGQFLSYIGPKKVSELKLVGHQIEKAVDYGFFSFMARPILWLMNQLQHIFSNWGLVIILLTFIVKMLLHPVNKKSMESMKGMQALQPKLKEIKEKYKDDQQKQNQMLMQLFKTHKVNPMSGCLPMVLQMPIYIVLYQVLWNAIELYHAPFFGPYQDLSAPDPYFVLPLLLGVFMFLQQKLTPSASADPTQQKMMMIMPVMFTGFMLFLPVGLVVYIFVNTVMSVVQQFMIRRDIGFRDLLQGRLHPRANGA